MDVAAVLAAYLGEACGFPWFHDAPASAAGLFGTVERSGGAPGAIDDRPTVTALVWGPSRAAAHDGAMAAARAIAGAPWELAGVFSADVLGMYRDPLDGRERYRVTAQLTVNG